MKTLTCRNVLSWRPPQNPFTETSSLAPSLAFEVLLVKTSPVRGWRSGSTKISWQTSVRMLVVISLISLWRIDGKPPRGMKKHAQPRNLHHMHSAWEYLVAANHNGDTEHQWRHRASTKAPLCRLKPNSVISSDVSQLEAPFSLARSRTL